MSTLDDILKDAPRARLIPTFAEPRKEQRTVSVLLATLSAVPSFARQLLACCEVRMGKTSELHSYTEVEFASPDTDRKDRPDGILRLLTRKTQWSALIEAKIDKVEIDEEQIQRYAVIARNHGIDAVITISNQLVPLPNHLPYAVPRRFSQRVKFFHISWISVLTQALLVLRDQRELSDEQAFILEEMTHYLEHPGSGVKRFDQMNSEWRSLCLGVRQDEPFRRSSPEIENTVTSWDQEVRDLCLMLSRRMDESVEIRISRKHQADPELRFKDTCDSLCESQELRCAFIVPNAASDIEITVNLERRTVACSMWLSAPGHKKRASAKINWLVRQLRNVADKDVILRVYWGRRGTTQATMSEIREDATCLEIGSQGALPSGFELIMIRSLGGRFTGRRTFIEDLENLVPEFYDQIGQNLRPWTPPPPSIDKHDPIEHEEAVDTDQKLDSGDALKPASNLLSAMQKPNSPSLESVAIDKPSESTS
ncbi:MAG: hypothetical protein OXC41_09045 [Gammaproteobacteria bacterium]|nr:hypothetical protein [Gammaproteobacteria bacterium]